MIHRSTRFCEQHSLSMPSKFIASSKAITPYDILHIWHNDCQTMDFNTAFSAMASGQQSKKRSLTIPFGKKGSRYVTATEVSKGLACGCVCPGCNSSLIACQDEKKRPYFRYESGSGCSGGLESVIHGMGKQIIQDHGWVLLPAYDAQVQAKDDNGRTIATKRFHAGTRITTFDSVELEKPEATFEPDVAYTDAN